MARFGCFVLIAIGIVVLVWSISRTSEPSSPKAVSPSEWGKAVQTPKPGPTTHAIREEFSIGYWSYRCNGATWARMLPSFGGAAEFPDGIFVVVDITAQNNDKSSSTLPPFHLLDTDGRKYDATSKMMGEGRFLGALEDLNPGVSKRGLVAFDVPPNRHYTLQVGGGFESGESTLVEIAAPAKPASEEPPPAPPADVPSPEPI